MIENRQPDLVVISGDLTQRAKPEQFRQAREFVDQIRVPTLVVPGNHDVPMYRVWERLFQPFGAYRRHFSEEMEPVYQDSGLFVLGLNTAHNWTVKDGRLSIARLRRAEEQLTAAPSGLCRIVVAHHPMVPAPRFDNQRVLTRAFETANMFSRCGVELVLSGHLHQTYFCDTRAYFPDLPQGTLLLQSGTSTSSRGRGCERGKNTCNWIEVGEQELKVSHLLYSAAEGTFFASSRHLFPRQGFQIGDESPF